MKIWKIRRWNTILLHEINQIILLLIFICSTLSFLNKICLVVVLQNVCQEHCTITVETWIVWLCKSNHGCTIICQASPSEKLAALILQTTSSCAVTSHQWEGCWLVLDMRRRLFLNFSSSLNFQEVLKFSFVLTSTEWIWTRSSYGTWRVSQLML